MLDTVACCWTRLTAERTVMLSALAILRVLLSEAMPLRATEATSDARIASPDSCVEIAMQQLRRRPRPPDLDGAQRWSALPDHTRQTLADLLTLLLTAHAGGARRGAIAMGADKIGAQHRAHKAVLYIRQSSAHQVQNNCESQILQYTMRDRLVQLGVGHRSHR
jgi:hypothetical protein